MQRTSERYATKASRVENSRLAFAAFAADLEGSAPVGLFVRRRDRRGSVHAHDGLDDDALFRTASGAFGDSWAVFSSRALAGLFLFSSWFGGHGRTLHQIAGREKSLGIANANTRDGQHTLWSRPIQAACLCAGRTYEIALISWPWRQRICGSASCFFQRVR